MAHPTRIGIKLTPQATTIATLREFWRLADEAGFDHLWTYDHLAAVSSTGLFEEPDPGVDVFDGWSLLAAMASETSRVRIGCMVTANTFRHPGVLAKIASTVDHLCAGRLDFGLGAGWNEYEHTMFELHLGGPRERIERLDEAIRLIKALWSSDSPIDFEGKHYRLRGAVSNPKPVQTPHPPLWLGGTGEKRMLRLVAEHADVWNVVNHSGVEECARLNGVLDRWCEEIGRDPATIRRSVQLRPDPARVVEDVAPFVAAGFTEVVMYVRPDRPIADAEAIAAQLPELRALEFKAG
jgi:F420-dependent oxidoreductase-like protein